MAQAQNQFDLTGPDADRAAGELFQLRVTFDLVAGCVSFDWLHPITQEVKAQGRLLPAELSEFQYFALDWRFAAGHKGRNDVCSAHASSVRALLNRIRKLFPLVADAPSFLLALDADLGLGKKGERIQLRPPPDADDWRWLTRQAQQAATMLDSKLALAGDPVTRGRAVLRLLACALLGVPPKLQDWADEGAPRAPATSLLHLSVTFNQVKGFAELVWNAPTDRSIVATGRVRATARDTYAEVKQLDETLFAKDYESL